MESLQSKIQDLQPKRPVALNIVSFDKPIQCDVCDDMGWVTVNVNYQHWAFGKPFPCPNDGCEEGQRIAQKQYQSLVKDSGIHPAFREFTFKTWDNLPEHLTSNKRLARETCEYFATSRGESWTAQDMGKVNGYDKPRASMVLAGTNGLGKTGLATCVANELVQQNRRVMFTSAYGLITAIQSTYGNDEKSDLEIYHAAINVPYLIIDEMGIENPTPNRIEIFERIIRGRHDRGLPYLITTNLVTQDDFKGQWGNQLSTAVFEDCHWLILQPPMVRSHSGEIICE